MAEKEFPIAKGLTSQRWVEIDELLARANPEQIKKIMARCLNYFPNENATIIFNGKEVI